MKKSSLRENNWTYVLPARCLISSLIYFCSAFSIPQKTEGRKDFF